MKKIQENNITYFTETIIERMSFAISLQHGENISLQCNVVK